MNELPIISGDASQGPGWRWDTADRIVRGTAPADLADPEIARAVTLRRYLDKPELAVAGAPTDKPCPFLEAAHDIFRQDSIARWLLEAYVLSGRSDREVAIRIGVPRKVVTAYVAVFFDVRPHNRPPCQWVLQHVIGPSPYRGFQEHEVRQYWAFLAFSCGPECLDAFIGEFLRALRPGDRPTLSVYFRPNVFLPVQCAVAHLLFGMMHEGDKAVQELHRRLDWVANLRDPSMTRAAAERAVWDVVSAARNILDGKHHSGQGNSGSKRRKGHGREQRPGKAQDTFASLAEHSLPILFQPY